MGCDGCEAAGESDCPHRQLIYRGMAHPGAYCEPANDPGKASTGAWVAMMKVSEGAVVSCLLFALRIRSGGVMNTACTTSTLPTEPLEVRRFPAQRSPRRLWKDYRNSEASRWLNPAKVRTNAHETKGDDLNPVGTDPPLSGLIPHPRAGNTWGGWEGLGPGTRGHCVSE